MQIEMKHSAAAGESLNSPGAFCSRNERGAARSRTCRFAGAKIDANNKLTSDSAQSSVCHNAATGHYHRDLISKV